MKALKIQNISKPHGAWTHCSDRYYRRLVVVETTLHHRQVNHKGLISVLARTEDVCSDYAGGRYGYGNAEWIEAFAVKTAKKMGLPLIGEFSKGEKA